MTEFAHIGRSTLVSIDGVDQVPAKIDTGADSSSIWATNIHEQPDGLHFTLFSPESPYYTGQEQVAAHEAYHHMRVVSSTGGRQSRYVVDLPITVNDQTVTASFSLADRRTLAYPMLLGCTFLSGRFLVDCSKTIPADMHHELIRQKHIRRTAAQQKEQV